MKAIANLTAPPSQDPQIIRLLSSLRCRTRNSQWNAEDLLDSYGFWAKI
jgi:hypothetical protein